MRMGGTAQLLPRDLGSWSHSGKAAALPPGVMGVWADGLLSSWASVGQAAYRRLPGPRVHGQGYPAASVAIGA
jgi:hypothetical protein